MLARGWERQLDRYRNGALLRRTQPLTAARYRAWLLGQAISYVALPDARSTTPRKAEARLLAAGAVGAPRTCAKSGARRTGACSRSLGAGRSPQPPASLTRVAHDSFTLALPRAGSLQVRVRFTPYWALAHGHGCVARAPGGLDAGARARARQRARRDQLLARTRVRARAAAVASLTHRLGFAPMLARARVLQARVLPRGWLDALRQVSLFAARLPRLPARARPRRGRGQRRRSRTRAT